MNEKQKREKSKMRREMMAVGIEKLGERSFRLDDGPEFCRPNSAVVKFVLKQLIVWVIFPLNLVS